MRYLKGKTSSLVKLGVIAHEISYRPVLMLKVGDSQETTFGGFGDLLMPEIMYQVIREFCGGITSVSPLSTPSSFGGTPAAIWLMRGTAANGAVSDVITGSAIPPGRLIYMADDDLLDGPLAILLPGAGHIRSDSLVPQTPVNTGTNAPPDIDYWGVKREIGVIAEAVVYRDGSTTADGVKFRFGRDSYGNTNFPYPAGSAIVTEDVVGEAGKTGFDRIRSSPYGQAQQDISGEYPVISCSASSDTNNVNLHCVGIRFYHPTPRAGFAVDSAGVGGQTTTQFLANHGSSGPFMAGMGDYDVVSITYGANDAYALTLSVEDYETNMRAIIKEVRRGFGQGTIIMLEDEIPRLAGGAASDARADGYRDVNEALSEEYENVVNFKQYDSVGDHFGWTRDNGTAFMNADGVHQNALGAQVQGEVFVEMLKEAKRYAGVLEFTRPRGQRGLTR